MNETLKIEASSRYERLVSSFAFYVPRPGSYELKCEVVDNFSKSSTTRVLPIHVQPLSVIDQELSI